MSFVFFIIAAVLAFTAAAFIAHPFMKNGSRGARRFAYGLMILTAAASVQMYLALGYPPLSAPMQQADIPDATKKELAAMQRLNENPRDVDAMAALAAIRIARGADAAKTRALLSQANEIAPDDERIRRLIDITDQALQP